MTGLRPVAELMFIDFIGVCLDQILNQQAKFRYMFGGRCTNIHNALAWVERARDICAGRATHF